MHNCSAYEDALLQSKMRNSYYMREYYPQIIGYHKNELLSFFDCLNSDYLISRKSRVAKIKTKEDIMHYQDLIKRTFKECLGELPRSGELITEKIKTVDRGSYLIDNLLLESLPGYFISANLYYPKNIQGKIPSVLFLCGHSHNGKAAEMYVDFCVEAVLNGFCVLTFDPLGQGERKMYSTQDSRLFDNFYPDLVHYMVGQQISLTGDNITQYMMLDNIRALDYLCTLPYVDNQRIAVTGCSGGGQMSAFMGAYDDRISVIAPVCYITEFKTMLSIMGAGEDEQSVPDFMKKGLDQADLITMAAPKPYMIGASLFDFFPIEGTRESYTEAKKAYRLLEDEGNLEIYISPKPHGFWHDTREKVLEFICRHFSVEFIRDKSINYEDIPKESELLCAPDGDIDRCNSITLQKIIESRANDLYPPSREVDRRHNPESYRQRIKEYIISVLSIRHDDIKGEIIHIQSDYDNSSGLHITDIALESEEYMKIYCTIYANEKGPKASVLLHIGETRDRGKVNELLKQYSAVACIETRGTGRGTVAAGSFFFEADEVNTEEALLRCNADMLGRCLMGMKVTDVLAVIKTLRVMEDYSESVYSIYGRLEEALVALFTAAAAEIKDIWLEELLYSYKSIINSRAHAWKPSIFARGILKYMDIEDVILSLIPAKIKINGLLDSNKNLVGHEVYSELTTHYNEYITLL